MPKKKEVKFHPNKKVHQVAVKTKKGKYKFSDGTTISDKNN